MRPAGLAFEFGPGSETLSFATTRVAKPGSTSNGCGPAIRPRSIRQVSDFATLPPGSAGAGCSATRIGTGRPAFILRHGVLSRGYFVEHPPDA